jgi:hypothetical protein
LFIGHYGVSFAIKRAQPAIPLWLLFIAVQFLDLLWAVLVLLGIERAHVTAMHRGSLPLDLEYMPYTHSLIAAIIWSIVGYAFCRAFTRGHRFAFLVALAIFSHWVFDLIVHRPDLPLYDNAHKVGLALWDHPFIALALEVALYYGALAISNLVAKLELAILGLAIVAIQVIAFWWPFFPNVRVAAAIFLAGYILLSITADWLETRKAQRINDSLLSRS